MTEYLTVADVLAIHGELIHRFGGAHGLRDPGLLEADLFRPQTGYYADLVEESAALWESLSQNHPFLDGNKRAAFGATIAFLAINGLRLTATADEATFFLTILYESNQMSFDKLVPWLRSNTSMNSDFRAKE